MAKTLVQTMADKWNPDEFHDDYRERLLKIIEEKAANGGKEVAGPRPKAKRPTNVVDLVAVLQKSLAETKRKGAVQAGATHRKIKKAA